MNRILWIALSVGILCSIFGCNKKADIILESYNETPNTSVIENASVSDKTGLCSEEEITDIESSVRSITNEYFSSAFSNEAENVEYEGRLRSLFISEDNGYINDWMAYINRHGVKMAFDSVTPLIIRITEHEDGNSIVTVRGYITTTIESDLCNKGLYDCTFMMDILIGKNNKGILLVDLSKAYESGLTAVWADVSHTIIQYSGEFVFDWDVTDEMIYNEEDDINIVNP